MRYNPSGAPASQSVNTAGLVEEAIGTWNGAGSGLRFVNGGQTAAATSLCDDPNSGGDGVNTIRWRANLRDGWLGSTCSVSSGQLDGLYRTVEADIVSVPNGTGASGTRPPPMLTTGASRFCTNSAT